MRIFILLGLIFTLALSLKAQSPTDSIALLSGIEVFGENKLQFVASNSIQNFKSKEIELRFSENLDKILRDYAGINIKTYGFGGMTNVGMRGSNSNHTAILWNGINLQDPLNGGFNLSLFPVFLIDDIKVDKGGSSALFGSGAMGGSIHLSNHLEFNKGWQTDIYTSIGSFSQYQTGASVQYSSKKIASLLKLYYKSAKNDFPFINTEQYGHPYQKQSNAEAEQYGLLQENSFLISKKQKLNTSIWLQTNKQNLPAQMSKSFSQKHQNNESARGQVEWTYFSNNYKIKVRNAVLYSELLYEDAEIDLLAEHQSFSNITEAEFILNLRKNDVFVLGLNNSLEIGKSDQLLDQQGNQTQRNRTAIFAAYKTFIGKKFTSQASIRKEVISNRFTPLTYSIGANWINIGNFNFNFKISKNYRIPTFNDLYWVDAMAKGNPDLKDESSLGQDLGMQFHKTTKSQYLTLGITAFNTVYQHLIQWVPTNGIWSPENKKEVWARGLETYLNYQITIKKWNIALDSRYSITHSTIEKKNENESENILGKQLILTPIHEGNIRLKLAYRNIGINYIQQFVGMRYLTADNKDEMPAYTLGDIALSWKTTVWKQGLQLRLRWNNIWNTTYQSMPNYAMPLNNYELSLRVFFNHHKK